jgi:hypothetical protein
MGKLLLVISMPVMICKNFDVKGGVVNGCIGMLKSIYYCVDNEGN